MTETNFAYIKLRLPRDLKTRVIDRSKKNKRSINAEIIDCIERALGLESSAKLASSEAVNQLVFSATSLATKTIERNFALDALNTLEKELLNNLDKLSQQKKKEILTILLALVKAI